MPAAKLTSKGQITLPKEVRDALGLETGDRVGFRIREDGTVVLMAETIDLAELEGSVPARVRGVSVDDMRRAVHEGAAGRTRGKRVRAAK